MERNREKKKEKPMLQCNVLLLLELSAGKLRLLQEKKIFVDRKGGSVALKAAGERRSGVHGETVNTVRQERRALGPNKGSSRDTILPDKRK